MRERFQVHFLSSGSTGNCTLVRHSGGNFIIDFGLPVERFLALVRAQGIALRYWREKRMKNPPPVPAAASEPLHAALVTHLHGDHFSASVLRVLADNGVRLFVHLDHLPQLVNLKAFCRLNDAGLVHFYDEDPFTPVTGMDARAFEVPHDSTATHGFLFQSHGTAHRFGYLADLGAIPRELGRELCDCDLLALEFNHDVQMERTSGRHPLHIARVLGSFGHLSNEQAAEGVRAVLGKRSSAARLACLALLHLSRDCNSFDLATRTASQALADCRSRAELLVTRHREAAGSFDLAKMRMASCSSRGRLLHVYTESMDLLDALE